MVKSVVSPFDVTITAEQVLGIHPVMGIPHDRLRLEHVGLPYKAGKILDIETYLKKADLSRDRHAKKCRKALISSAKFYYRFEDKIEKPTLFAQAYLDGDFDKLPEPVIFAMRQLYRGHSMPDINFKYYTKLGSHDGKYGCPSGTHLHVIRVNQEPLLHSVRLYIDGNPVDKMEVSTHRGCSKVWYS